MPEALPTFRIGRLPRITFGAGSFSQVPAVVATHGSRALLVTGARSFDASGGRAVLEEGLRLASIELVGRVSVAGEPGLDEIEAVLRAHRGADIEVVVGIGGGAALDAAKALAGLLRSGTSPLDHLEEVGRGLPYRGPALPSVAVPTTAGTGSEATRNAVITRRGADPFKRSFRDERLVPADAVVDPDLLDGASPALIAANGLDALSQLLEAMTSRNATPPTDALARSGLAAVRDGLVPWHRDPSGPGAPAARSRMAYAALLSGICLANAGLGAVHGLASPLGARLPIPHGLACGAVLLPCTRANIAALLDRPAAPALVAYAAAGRILADLGPDVPDPDACTALVEILERIVRELAIPGLDSFGITALDVASVVEDAAGGSMRTNPVPLDAATLTAIVEAAR
jgi:alcohol dehydrogenase